MKNFNSLFGFPKRGINFKLLLTFKSLNFLARPYMEVLLVHYRPTGTLCSADRGLLVQPKYNLKTCGTELFHTQLLRYGIPCQPGYACCELSAFKSKIKTFLFKGAFQL